MDVPTLVIIGVIVVIVLGPKKIPELARALGGAKKEFSDASSTSNAPTSMQGNGDDLMAAARKLGISTEGKTRDEISAEIVRKTANT
ncbi:MAG: twin-arginine translocase TatA/TatE family subunit [Thaumarchaeota archaeon]|nr:twin-arginine translocase TatA/TatE family subunit [Nitrososphaerota archaeon]